MAGLNSTNLSLMDLTKSNYGADSDAYGVAELLSTYNPITQYLTWQEANGTSSHKVYVRDTLPSVQWGSFNKGTASSKATMKEVVETMGFLEGLSETDVKVLAYGNNENKIRFDQDKAFIESLAQEFASTFFYGDIVTNPNGFKGLANRYNSLSGNIARSVVNGGGSGSDNTSIYIMNIGDDSTYGVYPKGSKAGIQTLNKGEYNKPDPDGNTMFVKGTYFRWDCGLAVANPYNTVRIANIDRSDLNGGSAADLVNLILEGISRLPIPPQGFIPVPALGYNDAVKPAGGRKTAILCNRSVAMKLRQQANAKTINGLAIGEAFGTMYAHVEGIPILSCDAITNSESTVA
ncbi:major capsid protein [Caudoviricetes sp.]|nr:major capsid protein [Caudoviricetes sp.]